MFCATEGVRSRFMLFAPDMFLGLPWASFPFFTFFTPELVFGGTEGVGFLFHVLRSRTRFQRYRGRRVPFSYFARPDSFSAVPRTSGPVFMFCAPGIFFGGTEGVRTLFHVLCSQTHFRRYRGRRDSISCFALPDSFSAVPRALSPVFMFCAHTRFWWYQGLRLLFYCSTRPDSFSAVPRASCPIIMSCSSGLIFGGTEGVRSRFHVLHSRTCFRRCRQSGHVFIFCAPGLVFGGPKGVSSCFNVLRSRIRFRRYRECQLPFSCFPRRDSFSAVPSASRPVLMLCAPGLIFGGAECVVSHFHVLRSRIRFRQYLGRPISFSCFLFPDILFLAVRRASGRVFMF
jgi:hypothetical protein